ncbi:MAG: hypothetical protein Kow00123_14280 [Anaerolineales bacterium]
MWFETAIVAPGVHRITEGGMVHAYLVQGETWAVLVDSGFGIGDIGEVVRGLTDLPILVVNTHAHLDHVGGNAHFDTVFMHRRESLAEVAEAARRFREMATQDDFPVPFPEGFAVEHYAPQVPEPTHRLAGGEMIDLGSRVLEVLPTPGHTAGSICLLDEGNRLLFAGDTITDRPLQGIGEGVSLAEYQATLRLLAEMAPDLDLLCPGHGPSPLVGSALEELAGAALRLEESHFQAAQVAGRPVRAANVGRFTFFVRLPLESGSA